MENKAGTIIFKKNDKINKVEEFLKVKGVWALLGSHDSKDYCCLNVGKSVDIGKELKYDIDRLDEKPAKEGMEEMLDYINQFAEDQGLKYCTGYAQDYLYHHLNEQYDDLVFILILSDDNNRDFEKKIAWITHSAYWRNGRPFRKIRKDYFKENYEKVIGKETKPKTRGSLEDWIKFFENFEKPQIRSQEKR